MPWPRWAPGSRGPVPQMTARRWLPRGAWTGARCCWSSLRSSASRARRWASARRTSVSCRSRGGAGPCTAVVGPSTASSPAGSVRNEGRRGARLERARPRSPRRIWPDRLGRPCRSAYSASRRRSHSVNLAETSRAPDRIRTGRLPAISVLGSPSRDRAARSSFRSNPNSRSSRWVSSRRDASSRRRSVSAVRVSVAVALCRAHSLRAGRNRRNDALRNLWQMLPARR